MWDLPRPGLEPVFPALAGRFSTTAPPGKPSGNLKLGNSALNLEFRGLIACRLGRTFLSVKKKKKLASSVKTFTMEDK